MSREPWEIDDAIMHRADIVANTISQPDDALSIVRRWGPALDRLNANLDRLQDRVSRAIEERQAILRDEERNDHE